MAIKTIAIAVILLFKISFILSRALLLNPDGPIIPDKYIVHLKSFGNSNIDQEASRYSNNILSLYEHHEIHREWLANELSKTEYLGSKLEHSFDFNNWVGYSGTFDKKLLEKIRSHPAVDFVEPDQMVWAYDNKYFFDLETLSFILHDNTKTFEQYVKHQNNDMKNYKVQNNAPWGLARASSRKKLKRDLQFLYPKSAGSNVNVYIIDTGINIDHEDFKGHAKWGITIPELDIDIDGNGHGTHCAGIIGSSTYGIAKNSTLIAVKVLRTNGFGTNSDVIKGVEWVLNQSILSNKRGQASVVNMSLGGGKSIALEKAIEITVNSGVHFAVAAGNDNNDACKYSPAGTKSVITVGASTIEDEMAYFSNTGTCVDIFAPGYNILSTWVGSENATNIISGTSMASPHVAGAMALYLAEKDYSPKDLKDAILKDSLENVLTFIPDDTANRLLNICALLK